jgi:hypothetical protein
MKSKCKEKEMICKTKKTRKKEAEIMKKNLIKSMKEKQI